MSHPSIYMASAHNAKAKGQSDFWLTALAVLLFIGVLITLQAPLKNVLTAPLIPFGAAAVAYGLCLLAAKAHRPLWQVWALRLIPYLLVLLFGGVSNVWGGLRIWLNSLIRSWNTIHSAGIPLFNVEESPQAALSVAILVACLCGQLAWLIVAKRKLLAGLLIGGGLLVLELLGGFFSPIGCALYLSGCLGLLMSEKDGRPSAQTVRAFAVCAVIASLLAMLLPQREIASVTSMREQARQGVHDFRYGEDVLPSGNLYNASALNSGSNTMLTVRSEYEKPLYLRGFVGASYNSGSWTPLSDAAYGGQYAGMLDWLAEQNFDPLTQVADYYALSDNHTVKSNEVTVAVKDASRYYIYAPSTLKTIDSRWSSDEKDTRLKSGKLFGASEYTFQEVSSSKPAELTVREDWVSEPTTEQQKQYSRAEAVYRDFVYNTYTTVNPRLSKMIHSIFWEDSTSDQDSIYGSVCRIRERLANLVSYAAQPNSPSDDTDPLVYFLTSSHKGNAVLYASVAVEAFRSHGIPARYVEGYHISADNIADSKNGTVLLTEASAHAWAEVYFDGIGWLPVDVTPGFYYDAVALQQMVAVPDAAHKKAALDDDEQNTHEVAGSPGSGARPYSEPLNVVINIMLVLVGIVAVLALLLTVVFLILEIMRLYINMHEKRVFRRTDAFHKVLILQNLIYSILWLWKLDASLGWNTEGTDEEIADRFVTVNKGEYARVAYLMEKSIYGEQALQEYELRTLITFAQNIAVIDPALTRSTKFIMFWKLRYAAIYRVFRPFFKKQKAIKA